MLVDTHQSGKDQAAPSVDEAFTRCARGTPGTHRRDTAPLDAHPTGVMNHTSGLDRHYDPVVDHYGAWHAHTLRPWAHRRDTAGMPEVHTDVYPVAIGAQQVELPLIQVAPDRAISLLMTIDRGVGFMERAGVELAALLAPTHPEVIASAATLGIPVAIEVSRALGLDDYVILQKTPKVHLGDALSEPVQSVTTPTPQRLLLDRSRVPVLAGRRVALVDDVVATGSSLRAGLALLRAAGAHIVGVGLLLSEGVAWQRELGEDASMVRALGRIPGFQRVPEGWAEDWTGE